MSDLLTNNKNIPTPGLTNSSSYFKETAKYEEGFANYYENNIKSKVKAIETLRQQKFDQSEKNKPKAKQTFWICIGVGLILSFVIKNIAPLILALMIGYFAKTAMISGPKEEVRQEIKTQILPEVIKFFGDYSYQGNTPFAADLLKSSKLFPNFNQAHYQDTITGTYRGKTLYFSEVDLAYRNGKSASNVFHGRIIAVETKMPITGTILIKQETQKGLMNKITGSEKGLQKIQISDSQFEQVFEAYTDDQTIALKIITPDFTQALLKINEQNPGCYVRCSFFQNYCVIAFATNYTKHGLSYFESTTLEGSIMDDIHKYLAEFHSVLETLDTLNVIKEINS